MADFATQALPVALQSIQMAQDLSFQKAGMEAEQSYGDAVAQGQLDALRATREVNQKQRQRDLEKALATKRANFAGMGMAVDGGSARAVLEGISEEARRDDAAEKQMTDLRASEISTRQTARARSNLLAYSANRDRRLLASLKTIL